MAERRLRALSRHTAAVTVAGSSSSSTVAQSQAMKSMAVPSSTSAQSQMPSMTVPSAPEDGPLHGVRVIDM